MQIICSTTIYQENAANTLLPKSALRDASRDFMIFTVTNKDGSSQSEEFRLDDTAALIRLASAISRTLNSEVVESLTLEAS